MDLFPGSRWWLLQAVYWLVQIFLVERRQVTRRHATALTSFSDRDPFFRFRPATPSLFRYPDFVVSSRNLGFGGPASPTPRQWVRSNSKERYLDAHVEAWNGYRAAYSISMDDGGDPQVTFVPTLLRHAFGLRATFYLCPHFLEVPRDQPTPDQLGRKWEWAKHTIDSFHEVAFHTHSHAALGTAATEKEVKRQFVDSLLAMNAQLGTKFASPQQGWAKDAKMELSDEARGVTSTTNRTSAGASSLSFSPRRAAEVVPGGGPQTRNASLALADGKRRALSGETSIVRLLGDPEAVRLFPEQQTNPKTNRPNDPLKTEDALHFAWPGGVWSDRAKQLARQVYRSGRGIECDSIPWWPAGEAGVKMPATVRVHSAKSDSSARASHQARSRSNSSENKKNKKPAKTSSSAGDGGTSVDGVHERGDHEPADTFVDWMQLPACEYENRYMASWNALKLANTVKLKQWLIGFGHGFQSCSVFGPAGSGRSSGTSDSGRSGGGSSIPVNHGLGVVSGEEGSFVAHGKEVQGLDENEEEKARKSVPRTGSEKSGRRLESKGENDGIVRSANSLFRPLTTAPQSFTQLPLSTALAQQTPFSYEVLWEDALIPCRDSKYKKGTDPDVTVMRHVGSNRTEECRFGWNAMAKREWIAHLQEVYSTYLAAPADQGTRMLWIAPVGEVVEYMQAALLLRIRGTTSLLAARDFSHVRAGAKRHVDSSAGASSSHANASHARSVVVMEFHVAFDREKSEIAQLAKRHPAFRWNTAYPHLTNFPTFLTERDAFRVPLVLRVRLAKHHAVRCPCDCRFDTEDVRGQAEGQAGTGAQTPQWHCKCERETNTTVITVRNVLPKTRMTARCTAVSET